jgi:hypothetical protein
MMGALREPNCDLGATPNLALGWPPLLLEHAYVLLSGDPFSFFDVRKWIGESVQIPIGLGAFPPS